LGLAAAGGAKSPVNGGVNNPEEMEKREKQERRVIEEIDEESQVTLEGINVVTVAKNRGK
jgi:hypothetical protein